MGFFTFLERFATQVQNQSSTSDRTETSPPSASPTFLNKFETYNLIMKDDDGYIKRFPAADLFYRNAPDADTYRQMSAKRAVSFHALEQEKLTAIAPPVDAFLEKYYAPPAGFRRKTPWVFALTEGTVYEHGEPHIRWQKNTPVLFLSTSRLAEILEDRCALGWELLYLRLAAIFPDKAKWSNGILPWGLQDTHWQFKDRFTLYCDSWYQNKQK